MKIQNEGQGTVTRRGFLQRAAGVSAAAILSQGAGVYAAGTDKIRVGLMGCGGRGRGAAMDCMNADPAVEIVAMADLFKDRLDGSLKEMKNKFGDRVKVTPEKVFVGFDAYQKVCDLAEVDIVISAAPPHFRPEHVKAAIEAGKHVFMEKPAGVCPAGIRSMLATAELAKKKGLAIVAGTQRRHQKHYEDIVNRVHDGAIGEIRAAQCYWNGGDMIGYWKWYEQGSMSSMEWQCRSWPWFTWLSGDHIVEQHVHNLDIVNWMLGAHPVKAMGMGGREVRKEGNIFDHFAVEYEYPGGIRVLSMCRQINGCANRVSETIVGTKGATYTDTSTGRIYGDTTYQYEGPNPTPYVQEHVDLIKSIRDGKPLNEGKNVAEGTLAGIMGRMSAYTGREMSWDWAMKASKLDLTPPKYEFGDYPPAPLAVPGKTPLI